MSFEIVRDFFQEKGLGERIYKFDVSSATVDLAAAAVGCEAKRIAKTLSFDVSGECILVVAAGDAKVDNAKYKAKFLVKAKMMAPDAVGAVVGHTVGGVCPFVINEGIKVYLDESLRRFESVYPACGSGDSAIELKIDELEKYSNYCEWVDVCKGWE